MALVDLGNENFDQETERHNLVILDFWAAWCAPCKAFAPVFAAAAAEYRDILFARINTEAEPILAKQFEVMSIPTVMTVKDGTIVHCRVGAVSAPQFAKIIRELLSHSP